MLNVHTSYINANHISACYRMCTSYAYPFNAGFCLRNCSARALLVLANAHESASVDSIMCCSLNVVSNDVIACSFPVFADAPVASC